MRLLAGLHVQPQRQRDLSYRLSLPYLSPSSPFTSLPSTVAVEQTYHLLIIPLPLPLYYQSPEVLTLTSYGFLFLGTAD